MSMEVSVYVEGPSDQSAMQALLAPLIEHKLEQGIVIQFFPSPEGDKKKTLLEKVPMKAVNILRNKPDSMVVAMPDLYPRNRSFPHETVAELETGIRKNFDLALQAKGAADDARLKDRFKIFCFKYDLEALLLASEEALRSRLGGGALHATWRIPVEDQDHDRPPKRIVEELFDKRGRSYQGTVDAPEILSKVRYRDVADRCSQCFKPFVDFLEGLGTG